MRIQKLKYTAIGAVLVILIGSFGAALIRAYLFEHAQAGSETEAQRVDSIEMGKALFQSACSDCHYKDSTETKMGPGLKDLFKRDKLPASGKKVTEDNVLNQLNDPYKNMPSFKDAASAKKQGVIEYLKTF